MKEIKEMIIHEKYFWSGKGEEIACLEWVYVVAQLIKNLPAMRETWIQSLVWEDPLEKVKATQSSVLA